MKRYTTVWSLAFKDMPQFLNKSATCSRVYYTHTHTHWLYRGTMSEWKVPKWPLSFERTERRKTPERHLSTSQQTEEEGLLDRLSLGLWLQCHIKTSHGIWVLCERGIIAVVAWSSNLQLSRTKHPSEIALMTVWIALCMILTSE